MAERRYGRKDLSSALYKLATRREAAALGTAFLLSVAAFTVRRLLSGWPEAPVDFVDLVSILVAYAASTLFIEHPEVVPATLRRAELAFDAALLSVVYVGALKALASGEDVGARTLVLLAALVSLKFVYDVSAPLLRRPKTKRD